MEAETDGLRWQYRIVSIGSFNAANMLGKALAYMGSHGWELVTVYDKTANWLQGFEKGFVLFKRPVAPGAEPDGAWSAAWTGQQIVHAYEQHKAVGE